MEWCLGAQTSPLGFKSMTEFFGELSWPLCCPLNNLRWLFHPSRDCLTFEYRDKARFHKTMQLFVLIVPQTFVLFWEELLDCMWISCWYIHARESTAVFRARGRWSHQLYSQGCHQYALTTHLWLHPLGLKQASWAREAHSLGRWLNHCKC